MMNFKNWVEQHNPQEKWNWNDPKVLAKQFNDTIKSGGNLDLRSVFLLICMNEDPGLTVEQNGRFLTGDY